MQKANKEIMESLEGFFDSNSGEVLEYMEKMLYEWYQHYAQDHYHIDRINDMVGGIFKVNDLLLKLNDAMISLKEEQGLAPKHLNSDHYDYSYAS
jgi:hypothetical protein